MRPTATYRTWLEKHQRLRTPVKIGVCPEHDVEIIVSDFRPRTGLIWQTVRTNSPRVRSFQLDLAVAQTQLSMISIA